MSQIEEKDGKNVASFLRRIAAAASKLAQETIDNEKEMDQESEDLAYLVDIISRRLIQAASPDILVLDTDDFQANADSTSALDDSEDSKSRFWEYQYRRSDYLRLLLRLIAPVSMHVASQICSSVISEINEEATSNDQFVRASFLLFSHWLPVAPHLAPMVIDLFRHLPDPWKNLDFERLDLVFLFAEAGYKLISFFVDRGQNAVVNRLWDWTFLFGLLHSMDTQMAVVDSANDSIMSSMPKALQWYAARALTRLFDWKPQVSVSVLERLELSSSSVPWEPHPWTIEREERRVQVDQFRRMTTLWGSNDFPLPSSAEFNKLLPTSKYLADMGDGVSFYKHNTLCESKAEVSDSNLARAVDGSLDSSTKSLIPTRTTCRNLSLLGSGLCQDPHPPPIMICGPHGSGKSSLIREVLRLCRPADALLEFHIDEETDSKTLIGSYSTTDVPGEFAWRPGALTHATREGRWVLFEDIDAVPLEIQATIVKLLEDRILPLGNGRYERCHPDFRIFSTCTTSITQHEKPCSLRFAANRGGGKRILNPSLWRKVHVQPLPFSELREIALSLFPHVPDSVVDASLSLMQALDQSGRSEDVGSLSGNSSADNPVQAAMESRIVMVWTGGRNPSVRDFFKLLSRISHGVCFEKNTTFATEGQRTICLAESVDIFVGACPERQRKLEFVTGVAAPIWGVSGDLATSYVERRRPTTRFGADFVEIGRSRIQVVRRSDFSRKASESFAQTNHALRLMEAVGVCVQQNEPVLLVGETGCGKTSLIQQLAAQCEGELIVQNLSLQTDSTDLLGGFKPLELKNVARRIYQEFVDLFVSTFSRKQNAKFLQFAATLLEKASWKKLSQCFQRAAKLGTAKMREIPGTAKDSPLHKNRVLADSWERFNKSASKFERQVLSCDAGMAFVFSEGALVDAIQNGKWVLLDEINLASSDTLQRLCGLLDEPTGSVTLTERGDASAVPRHPDFRLFAAMNPATDSGKKDLPASIRSRFSELYVDELLDPVELRVVAARYLEPVLPVDGKPSEHKNIVIASVEVYLKCREMADTVLSDGAGHKPRYTLRTLCRALVAARTLVSEQRIPLSRAIFEGFQLAFEGALDASSMNAVKKILKSLLPEGTKKADLEHPGRRPGAKNSDDYVLLKPFWIQTGLKEPTDWSTASANGKSRFILTPSVQSSLRRLSRALAAGPWPVLLEGPTSAGKTTLVEYIAARCGHHVVRINNHEHTDVQEYTGSFAGDQNGSLSFRDGLLVRALRKGHWVILDELNLAPSEVLEALNRLLDDNRELYLAETNETIKPHPGFRLFATQNPSGAYGGRKPLSRAFRNRFVEIHMGDIPCEEMITILEKRCGCPPSSAKRLVDIMVALRFQRSKSNVFMGKDSFITPRDLLRWAERKSSSKFELAQQGYMLLAERLRTNEEKELVQSVLEEHLKVKLNMAEIYYGPESDARKVLDSVLRDPDVSNNAFVSSIAPTQSLLRLISLVMTCIEQKEPVLLVGDTGCGKTTVVQFLSLVFKKILYAINCHATTETSDLLGGLRPVRGRDILQRRIQNRLRNLIQHWPHRELLNKLELPDGFKPEELDHVHPPDLDDDANGDEHMTNGDHNQIDVEKMVLLAHMVFESKPEAPETNQQDAGKGRTNKRRKLLTSSPPSDVEDDVNSGDGSGPRRILDEIKELAKRHASLFEWSDGPLVKAMKGGQMLLLDEMSLAEDAVLERLNSVLEPSRTLVLAEKGDDGSTEETRVIVAHTDFRVFATMNPGGDFGKRELSPALRSRFTEIWVPAVTERADFELVLSRTLEPSRQLVRGVNSLPLLQEMLAYVEWFNESVCGEPSSLYAGYTLSLRDISSWAKFIVEARQANGKLGLWEAYIHGAALMHLDGLGLGSGLALEDANTIRKKAELFLSKQGPAASECSSSFRGSSFIAQDNGLFGAAPFFIPVGQLNIHQSHFNMGAPTTAINAFRVLRAMQLQKPVLLEGSPGVGKTSLITALAAASGHKLVRINLSEQTDIADLMGSDLPVQNSSNGGASFEWCDGILLTAIKEGSWVLLDELNLASQSVLEGLNSCLDHRATVFIPELGRTFHCPPTFRVFGAQNPLGQGGGRKGLPKSFLNRFTKVYVDALKDSDLRTIVASQFPACDTEQVNMMIDFNTSVHVEVTERREYGSEGSPWEFNLRDVFRWCQLLETKTSSIESYARDVYFQRFRHQNDRIRVDRTFHQHFQSSMQPERAITFNITGSHVQIGDTFLPRMDSLNGVHESPLNGPTELYLSRLPQLEAIARCVNLRWPCLLIGSSGSGKTSLVASLAELCNTTLVEQCLSPSSDVTELLGCFEQVESKEFEIDVTQRVCELVDDFFVLGALKSDKCARVWVLVSQLKNSLQSGIGSGNVSELVESVFNLCKVLETELERTGHIDLRLDHGLKSLIAVMHQRKQKQQQQQGRNDAGHFIWRDGILVEAMTKGYWLVLDNVNLCPSSVLDRLNSVMEKDGELLLSECGTLDGEGSSTHRMIKPHENFRIFLSMNAANGEVSRAMRNRCIELYLPQIIRQKNNSVVSITSDVRADLMSALHTHGARTLELASTAIESHLEEHRSSLGNGSEIPSVRSTTRSMAMASSLLLRGTGGAKALVDFFRVGYELEDGVANILFDSAVDAVLAQNQIPVLPSGSVRGLWLQKTPVGSVEWDGRVLRFFEESNSALMQKLNDTALFSLDDCDPLVAAKVNSFTTVSTKLPYDYQSFRRIAARIFLSRMTTADSEHRLSYFNGSDSSIVPSLRWMASALEKDVKRFRKSRASSQTSGETSAAVESSQESALNEYLDRCTLQLLRYRLDQTCCEQEWLKNLLLRQNIPNECSQMTVLEASFLLNESVLDRSTVPCPVTAAIYPLFCAMDSLLDCIFAGSIRLDKKDDERLASIASSFCEERDRFWSLLQETSLLSTQSRSFLGFEEAEFLVQWKWLKRTLRQLQSEIRPELNDSVQQEMVNLDSLVRLVDGVIFGGSQPSRSTRAICKKMVGPQVPRETQHWKTMFDLRSLADQCSLTSDRLFFPYDESLVCIDLKNLVDQQHPLLFVETEFRSQILAVLSTFYASLTDDIFIDEGRTTAGVELGGFEEKLKALLEDKRKDFSTEINNAKVDTAISTVENQLTLETMEKLRDSSPAASASSDVYSRFTRRLLNSFSKVQLTPLFEYWCMVEENTIIGQICRALVAYRDKDHLLHQVCVSFLPRLKAFVNNSFSCMVWSISELRPYQTLIWIVESWSVRTGGLENCIRSLLSPMLASRDNKIWSNSFNRTGVISMRLEVPNMWTDDEGSSAVFPEKLQNDDRVTYGSVRLHQQIRSELLMGIVGQQLALTRPGQSARFHSIENHENRVAQYQAICTALSSMDVEKSKSEFFILLCLTSDVVEAMREGLQCRELDALIERLKRPSELSKMDLSVFEIEVGHSANETLQELLPSLILPLVRLLQEGWRLESFSEQYDKNIALSSIYLGLLRLQFLSPDSPLDPGRAPLAKVSLIDRRFIRLGTELVSRRLHSGFTSGDFTPSTELSSILDDGEKLTKKRFSQEKKVVRRSAEANPFHELFRLANDFVCRVSSTGSVLQLVESLLKNETESVTRNRVNNWQRTSSAFCRRLVREFPDFEDVTTNLVNAVRMIQDGVETLSKSADSSFDRILETDHFGLLVQYPTLSYDITVDATVAALSSLEKLKTTKDEKTNFHYALASNALIGILIKKQLFGKTKKDVKQCRIVLNSLSLAQTAPVQDGHKDERIEDIQERKFREQFPDHRKEFNKLFETTEEDMSDEEDVDETETQEEAPAHFSDEQLELLCNVFHDIFDPQSGSPSDTTRALVFHSSYNAANSLERIFNCTRMKARHSEPMSGHVFAMALTLPSQAPASRVFPHLYREGKEIDFQNEANPAEAITARGPLERLMARSTQLLTAFPGHSILLGIGRVCDKVCKFDLMKTPIGKVMTGLEIILRQAQEWEQHASDRVRLGTSLQDVGKLVARWRKLELESWPQLIVARKYRHRRKARRHLLRLQSILGGESQTVEFQDIVGHEKPLPGSAFLVPNWIWKGASSAGQTLSLPLDSADGDDLAAVTKVLDTFILTAPLGEFHERLKIVKTCSVQLDTEQQISRDKSNWKLQQSRALHSVYAYYNQFAPVLAAKLDSMIGPIQTKLKGEVKLAKWDEQTYYALAESSEKNQRKLMKILGEFDECLALNAGQLIQAETIKGIRSSVDAKEEVSITVPQDSTIFPLLQKGASDGILDVQDGIHFVTLCNRAWTAPPKALALPGTHIFKIHKYAKKMETLATTPTSGCRTWARVGMETAASLSEAILERIGSLRAKSTRPMKERALVDLFRELKRNGFTTTKWSVPKEVRYMEQLFQLPAPNVEGSMLSSSCATQMDKAERYYQKCLTELNAYRSESMLLGSRHMGKREVDLMLTLGESGLHLIAQQRCLVSSIIEESLTLKTNSAVMSFDEKKLPLHQALYTTGIEELRLVFIAAVESLRQLSLLIRSSQKLFDSTEKVEWARDAVMEMEQCIHGLNKHTVPYVRQLGVVTHSHLNAINDIVSTVDDVRKLIIESKNSCLSVRSLPLDSFDVTIQSLTGVLTVASRLSPPDVEKHEAADVLQFGQSLSLSIERTLIGYQSMMKSSPIGEGGPTDDVQEGGTVEEDNLWLCHKEVLGSWASTNLRALNESVEKTVLELKRLHNVPGSTTEGERERLVALASDVGILVSCVEGQARNLFEKTAAFYSTSAKLVYVLLRVFRVLLSKGFCSDETTDDDGSEAEGDVNGMTFEDDQDGTGMGEGDGKNDVTDQLESEEQITGLKSDQDNEENAEKQESRQLNEEEADQGMEMEADFDGEMCDLPDKPQDDDAEEEEEGEELEREIGEEASPDEQVVDERMWNESDDEDDVNNEEEKFEKDSGVEGEAIDGATRTKEEEGENAKEDDVAQGERQDESNSPEDPQDTADEDNEEINDDLEDRYEDKHGVDVKEDEKETDDAKGDEDQMQLDDELNLDGEDNDSGAPEGDDEPENPGEDELPAPDNETTMDIEAGTDGQDVEEDDDVDAVVAPAGIAEPMDEDTPDPENEENTNEENPLDVQNQESSMQEAHGIRANDGNDAVAEDAEDAGEQADRDDTEAAGDTAGSAQANQSRSDSQGGSGFSERDGTVDESTDTKREDTMDDMPNPFKDPGDASKFWHRKLNVVDSDPQSEEKVEESIDEKKDPSQDEQTGDFEYTSQDQEKSTQVLGEATEEEAVELAEPEEDQAETQPQEIDNKEGNSEQQEEKKSRSENKKASRQPKPADTMDAAMEKEENDDIESNAKDNENDEDGASHMSDAENSTENELTGNHIVSDLARLNVVGGSMEISSQMIEDEQTAGISSAEAEEARAYWLKIQGETYSLSRRLCEKLRLVMEPLVASKLRGDYRTGKRINMKRVIGYIASGYRKDKIWLRRTKPAKRDYRVLLAVDDSESMKKSGAGEMALRALSTLAVGMNQLDIGELGIASFGEDMKLLHPFHRPFTSDSGADIAMNLKFDQRRTRTSLCVESAIASLDAMGGQSSMQLVFMISDGRIERDSRETLKRLIREMMERNILLAMIIVEGEHKKKDSIVNMKEVTFEKGKPVVKRFIEDYPFPYYVILEDMVALPEVLGDALRQWFEMLTQLQTVR